MAFTRFKYDDCRTEDRIKQSSGPMRYILSVPGPGSNTNLISDPYIRLQKYGANIRNNPVDVNSDLLGLTRNLTLDCCDYKKYQVKSKPMFAQNYNYSLTNQPRESQTLYEVKEKQHDNFDYLFWNPEVHANLMIPFENNLSSRIVEKDKYVYKNC